MELVADRFIVLSDGAAVDLATGFRVLLRIAPADAATDVQWSAQCGAVARLRHRTIAPLLDYGMLGRGKRFEAWQCGPPWTGDACERQRGVERASRFLAATGLAVVRAPAAVHMREGVPVVVPSIEEPRGPVMSEAEVLALPLEDRGLQAIDNPALRAVAEMFHAADGTHVHALAVLGPPASDKELLLLAAARLARINGFVPVATPLLDTAARRLWCGRSLAIIDAGQGNGCAAIVDAALASPVRHALLVASTLEVSGMDGVVLRPLAADTLLAAIQPRPMSPAVERVARRAASRAGGWAGRFARLVWGSETTRGETPRRVARVAEQPAIYSADERVAMATAPRPESPWSAPGELTTLRRRTTEAARDCARGRHAAAIRGLRLAVAGFGRRGGWTDATAAGLELARVLLRRGHVRDVEAVLDEARNHAARAGTPALLVDAAILAGEMWIDRIRLDEAETILSAALTSTAALGEADRRGRAGLVLARCLFWRGRYDEAYATAERVEGTEPSQQIRRERWLARIAAGRGDTTGALRMTRGLLAAVPADACTQGAVEHTAALVYLAAGDAASAAAHAHTAIDTAKRAHDPLRGVRGRIVLAEAERRRGNASAAAVHAQRLARLARTLPPLLQAQVAPLQHVRTLPPLHLLLPVEKPSATRSALPLVDQVITIVRACQTADDEGIVLRDVCARVRQQLYAAAVAFVTGGGDTSVVLAVDGARPDVDIAQRAVDAGLVVAPHRLEDRIVAAAPIQFGGSTIGALTVRWTLGSTADLSLAPAVLATTAVAAAPIVSAALVHRERTDTSAGQLLLGATSAMDQVRRLIARAAAAPFPVLIEGESGSGKELVAQAIHRSSPRRGRPFRALNCAAIPDELAEAELFGHVRGSFTGAMTDRTGVFEESHGGTLFLDEVGELSPRAQAKLLRVLQEGEIRRVGENLVRRVDVRVVAATNRDLRVEHEAGRFRLDLLYRLDVIRISLPPLRDRADDVAMLAEHFWREATARVNSRATLTASTLAALARYSWPGNVRELQNVLASLAVRSPKRGAVPAAALPPSFNAPQGSPTWRLEEARRTFEERFVRAALARSGGHRARAAQELGVSRQGLTKLMSRLGIS